MRAARSSAASPAPTTRAFKSATFPGDFFFNISVFVLCMVILGGMGNVWGVIVGAAFLAYLNQEGLANTGSWINTNIHVGGWHPNIDVPLYASGIYGVIIVLVMLFRPEGLLPSKRRGRGAARGRRTTSRSTTRRTRGRLMATTRTSSSPRASGRSSAASSR